MEMLDFPLTLIHNKYDYLCHTQSALHTSQNKQVKIFSVLRYLLKCMMCDIIQAYMDTIVQYYLGFEEINR